MCDVDFGDMLDYLAGETDVRGILLYIEAVTHARKFMSAARAAARIKPVVVIKAGRHPAAARAVASHTGAMAGQDAVYDAAFRRAGMLRVHDIGDLFGAVETLGMGHDAEGRPAGHPDQRRWHRRDGGRRAAGSRRAASRRSATRRCRRWTPCCRGPGRTATPSTSSATRPASVMPRRWRSCSKEPERRRHPGAEVPDRGRLQRGCRARGDRHRRPEAGAACSPAGSARTRRSRPRAAVQRAPHSHLLHAGTGGARLHRYAEATGATRRR